MKSATKTSRTLKSLAVAGTLAFAVAGAFAQSPGKKWEPTEFQKNLPGPAKLEMPQADYSGQVNTNAQFIADRLAILNHMTAYAFLIDEGRWDEWYELFAPDVVFETTAPCIAAVTIKGRDAFKAFTDVRYGAKTTAMRRHTMGNVHVAEQTPTTAKVRSYMLISAVPNADKLNPVTTGTYNASMEKRNGKWTITRWYIEVDAQVAPSAFPPNIPKEAITVIPDTREACVKK